MDKIEHYGHYVQNWTLWKKIGQNWTMSTKLDITDKIEESDRTVQIKYVETLENQEDLKIVV